MTKLESLKALAEEYQSDPNAKGYDELDTCTTILKLIEVAELYDNDVSLLLSKDITDDLWTTRDRARKLLEKL